MKATLKLIAAAAMIVGAGAANATLSQMDTGNSSLLFIALDSTGTPTSFAADLGFRINQFSPDTGASDPFTGTPIPGSSYYAPGTTITWNFNTNAFTVNGAAQSTAINWSAAYSVFNGLAQTGETTWGVIAGDQLQSRFLTTGNPTSAQLAAVNASNLSVVDPFYTALRAANTQFDTATLSALATNGTATNDASGYAGSTGNFGTDGKWQGNLNFSALAGVGTSQGLYYLDGNVNSAEKVGGTFSYAAGVLTYSVAAVPEGDGLALAMAGLGLLGFVARRRQSR